MLRTPIDRSEPWVAGPLADPATADAFAHAVHRIHRRYAAEVVAAFRLCPFLRDIDAGFGRFCVILETEPSFEIAEQLAKAADGPVVHFVYPLVDGPSAPFERFGSALAERLARILRPAPVHASFHPAMVGSRRSPAEVVGLIRRAPDPFVQLVPAGLAKGGTAFMDTADPTVSLPEAQSRGDLEPAEIDAIEARLEAIRRDRDETYAPFLAAIKPER